MLLFNRTPASQCARGPGLADGSFPQCPLLQRLSPGGPLPDFFLFIRKCRNPGLLGTGATCPRTSRVTLLCVCGEAGARAPLSSEELPPATPLLGHREPNFLILVSIFVLGSTS